MNVAMWAHALRRMPRPSKKEWGALDPISRYLIAVRAAVLLMTFLSAAIAGVLAYKAGAFDPLLWVLVTLGLLLAHASNNLVNDWTDQRTGVDEGNYFRTQYGPQILQQGYVTAREFGGLMLGTGIAALTVAGIIVMLVGTDVLWLIGAGVFCVLFYTWPLKYLGLGEPTVFVVWGPLMIAGGAFTITGVWSWDAVWASLPYALGVTSVLFGKHIDKLDADRKKGVRTLPVLLGERDSRYAVLAMMILQYVCVASLVITGSFSWVLAIVVFALKPFWIVARVFAVPAPQKPPDEFPEGVWPLWYVAGAFWHNARFGFLYFVGLMIDAAITVG